MVSFSFTSHKEKSKNKDYDHLQQLRKIYNR